MFPRVPYRPLSVTNCRAGGGTRGEGDDFFHHFCPLLLVMWDFAFLGCGDVLLTVTRHCLSCELCTERSCESARTARGPEAQLWMRIYFTDGKLFRISFFFSQFFFFLSFPMFMFCTLEIMF